MPLKLQGKYLNTILIIQFSSAIHFYYHCSGEYWGPLKCGVLDGRLVCCPLRPLLIMGALRASHAGWGKSQHICIHVATQHICICMATPHICIRVATLLAPGKATGVYISPAGFKKLLEPGQVGPGVCSSQPLSSISHRQSRWIRWLREALSHPSTCGDTNMRRCHLCCVHYSLACNPRRAVCAPLEISLVY